MAATSSDLIDLTPHTTLAPNKPQKKVTFHSPVITETSTAVEVETLLSPDSDSGIDSTRAEAGSDNEADKPALAAAKDMGKGKGKEVEREQKGEVATADDTSDADSSDVAPEWTRAEDRIILMRKSETKSWAKIGKEINRGRRECQQRYRALLSHAKELGIEAKKLVRLYTDEDEDEDGDDDEEPAKTQNKGKSKENGGGEKSKKAKIKGKSKSKSKIKGDGDELQNGQGGVPTSKKGVSKLKLKAESKPKPKNKSKKKAKKSNRYPLETPSSSSSSWFSSSSSSNSDSSSDDDNEREQAAVAADFQAEAEYWAQRQYVYDTLNRRLYADQKVLRPDRFYSESDCRILAGLEARHRADKWLHIQADFYNATGRMVAADLLRTKFYEN